MSLQTRGHNRDYQLGLRRLGYPWDVIGLSHDRFRVRVARVIWVSLGTLLVWAVGCANSGSPGLEEKGTPAQSWQIQFSGTYSAPIIQAGVLYIGSGDGALYALDPASGQEHWRFQTGEALGTSNVITVPDGSSPAEMMTVGASNAALGRRRIEGSPVVVGDNVVIASEDNHVYAVNATTGQLAWSVAARVSYDVIVADDERIYVSSKEGAVYAFDARSGTRVWSFGAEPGPQKPRGSKPPVLADGTLFVSVHPMLQPNGEDAAALFALDAASGRERWSVWLPKRKTRAPVVAAGTVFVVQERDGAAELSAYEAASGTHRWRAELPNRYDSRPVRVLGNTLVWATDVVVAAFDLASGAERWRRSFDPEEDLAALVAEGETAYALTYTEHTKLGLRAQSAVYALDRDTGAERWVFRCGRFPRFCQARLLGVYDGVLLLGGSFGVLLDLGWLGNPGVTAVRTTDGEQLWHFRTPTVPSGPAESWNGNLIVPSKRYEPFGEEPTPGQLRAVGLFNGR